MVDAAGTNTLLASTHPMILMQRPSQVRKFGMCPVLNQFVVQRHQIQCTRIFSYSRFYAYLCTSSNVPSKVHDVVKSPHAPRCHRQQLTQCSALIFVTWHDDIIQRMGNTGEGNLSNRRSSYRKIRCKHVEDRSELVCSCEKKYYLVLL